jgi:hypothetical protein
LSDVEAADVPAGQLRWDRADEWKVFIAGPIRN